MTKPPRPPRRRKRKVRFGRLLAVLITPVLILYALVMGFTFIRSLFHQPAVLSQAEKSERSLVETGYQNACPQEVNQLTRFGIDVSQFQGDIDWYSVAESGVEYAFVRVGAKGYGTGEIYEDEKFLNNLYGAKETGIPVGVYFFSQAISDEEALQEADYVLSMLNGYPIELPVVFDFEQPDEQEARTKNLPADQIASQARVFLERIREGGYQPMLYLNRSLFPIYENAGLTEQYPLWYAQYGVDAPDHCGLDIWQYSESGTIPGISDHHVDLNLMRTDFNS